MQHSFDVDIAENLGLLEAILLNNIWFWIEKNKANNENYYDNCYWTYNSSKALGKLFPYASERQIQTALKKLINSGILKIGNYNKSPYDRTLWYALTPTGNSIMQKCKIDYAKMSNGLCKNVTPIPDINTYIKEMDNNNKLLLSTKKSEKNNTLVKKNEQFIPPTLEEVKAYCEKRNNGVDYQKVYDYYSANNWCDSKGKKVKNWKLKIIGVWEKNVEVKQQEVKDTSYVDENGLIHI